MMSRPRNSSWDLHRQLQTVQLTRGYKTTRGRCSIEAVPYYYFYFIIIIIIIIILLLSQLTA